MRATVNGTERSFEVSGPESAVDVVRGQWGLTGTKLVCAGGVCGACTVQLDGTPVASCLTPATALADREVTTVEGIATDDDLHPVQRAFLAEDALQCGYCTPGFIVSATHFVKTWRAKHGDVEPERAVIADALAGHLCRCGAYEGIYRAVAAACRGDHDVEGGSTPRVDGPAKVTGTAIYTADYAPDGVWTGIIVRSTVAAGTVAPIPADAAPVLVDLLGDDRAVRWVGQPIAAVAAPTYTQARRIAADLPVHITPEPFVTDSTAAAEPDAPSVYTRDGRSAAPNAAEGAVVPTLWRGNVRGPIPVPYRPVAARNRLNAARRRNARGYVDTEVTTSAQLHTAFEPHGCVADWSDPERLTVHASTQAVDILAHQIAQRFDIDVDKVEVNAEFVGGGFGAKATIGADVVAAVGLSRAASAPVRVILTRREELTATGNRPGSQTRIRLAVSDDGDLEAVHVDARAHTGVSINGTYGPLALLAYGRGPRYSIDRDILTNTPPGSAFRGPGGPTAAWALETAIDIAAHRLGRDPLDLRSQWDGNDRRQALYEWAAGLDVWQQRGRAGEGRGRFRRGVGVAAAHWMYLVKGDAHVTVGIEDGALVVTCATQDIGTGTKSVLARAVAEVFNIAPADVVVSIGTGGGTRPTGPTSGGSQVTGSVWGPAVEAAKALHRRIGGRIDAQFNGMSETARRDDDARRFITPPIGELGIRMGHGLQAAVHVAEVEVDTHTGKVRVLRMFGGLAIGRPHVPELARSQAEGGIIQAIGLTLYENQVIDPHTGATLTNNLEDYRIPQLGDTPEMTIHFHEPGFEHVPGGGVGLGEITTISPTPAIGNAVFNATGWRPLHLPIRPDRVLEGLR